MISQPNIEWLTSNIDIWQRHKVGNYKYLTDDEKKLLQKIAKEIDPERYFSIYACDACIRDLVKFVFTHYDKQILAHYESSNDDNAGYEVSLQLPEKSNYNGQELEIQGSEKGDEGITANNKKRLPRKPRK